MREPSGGWFSRETGRKRGAKGQAARCRPTIHRMPERRRSRGGPTTKIHALTDSYSRAVAVTLGPGNEADISSAPEWLNLVPPPERLLADKGYDANSLRKRLADSATEAVIPSTRSRKTPIPYDAEAYRERNRIERTFCRLKDRRRIATRYHKLAANFASAVAIAATIIWWT